MKKFILGLTIGLVIAISIGVYATNQILASEIDYKNGKKVSDALDDLYTKANKDIYEYLGTPVYYESYGTANLDRTISQSVSRGKYFVLISEGQAWNYTNETYTFEDVDANITCASNNCVLNKIATRFTRVPSSTSQKVVNNRYYLYYLEVKEITDTVNILQKSTTYTTSDPQYLDLALIPIDR